MKEREFQGWVLDVAARYGWRAWHVPTPMRPIGQGRFVPDPLGAGLPDLILLHDDPPRLIFAELKTTEGTLSARQREFLGLARAVATEALTVGDARVLGVYIWRPGLEDLIETTLKAKVMIA